MTYTYNPHTGQREKIVRPNGTETGYTYGPGGSVADAYDSRNCLTSRNNGEIVLDYNGDADRVRKSVQAGADQVDTTLYLVDDLNPTGAPQVLEELDAFGQVTKVYTYGPQLLSADQRMAPEASYGPHPGSVTVTASSFTGTHVPENVLDGLLSTRWEANAGEYITAELAQPARIASVELAFYRGDACSYRFDIQLSGDGLTWDRVGEGLLSGGIARGFERFGTGRRLARYVRIVGIGNSAGGGMALTQMRINTVAAAASAELPEHPADDVLDGAEGDAPTSGIAELDVVASTPLLEPSGGSTWLASYYGYDGQGNVRFLTDDAGQITDTYDYDSFGNLISRTGSTPNDYLYMGQQLDQDLGLYYLRARYYDPKSGRFWTMDTFQGPQGQPETTNKYAYAQANPTSYADPTGNFAFSLHTLMIDSQIWYMSRRSLNDGFTEAPLQFASIYQPGGGVMLSALSTLAAPKTHMMLVGSEDGRIVGGLVEDATQGRAVYGGDGDFKLFVPHHNYFTVQLPEDIDSKVERDAEMSQLTIESLRFELNTNGLLDRQPRNPRYDDLNFWLETSYHTGFFKALQVGGDPMTGSMEVTIYPAHTGLGGQAAFSNAAPIASGMKRLRPHIGQNPGGSFHQAVDYYHFVSTTGLPPLDWTGFLAQGGWVLQGIASTALAFADAAPGFVVGILMNNPVGRAAVAIDWAAGTVGGMAGGDSFAEASGLNALGDAAAAAPGYIASLASDAYSLASGNCFVAGTPVLLGNAADSAAIEDLRVGMRVRTAGQDEPQDSGTRIDPAAHRLVRCEMPHADGGTAVIETLMSRHELEARRAAAGGRLYLHLDELQLFGWAKVLSIDGCPDIAPGPGRVVVSRIVTTGKRDVLELTLEPADADADAGAGAQVQTIGVTAGHPLFSLDRNAWVLAGELRVGERLRTAAGETRVREIRASGHPATVYNIEVEQDHVYYAGQAQVLAHNISKVASMLLRARKTLGRSGVRNVIDKVRDKAGKVAKGGPSAPNRGAAVGWAQSKADSAVLRRNLGITDPAEAAHHIVAGGHSRAAGSRAILERYQIDINSAENGVALIGGKGALQSIQPRHHRGSGLHTYRGIDAVERRLRGAVKGVDDWATGREAIIDELARIRQKIQNGTFP